MDSRFTGRKHFWSCVAVDRPKDVTKFLANIKLYENEGDFTKEEEVSNLFFLTGRYPCEIVVSQRLKQLLKNKGVPPISEYDPELEICWGVPTKIEIKVTKTNKQYYEVTVIDDSNTAVRMRCWGVDSDKDKIYVHRPYIIKPTYDSNWGFSGRGPTKNYWQIVG